MSTSAFGSPPSRDRHRIRRGALYAKPHVVLVTSWALPPKHYLEKCQREYASHVLGIRSTRSRSPTRKTRLAIGERKYVGRALESSPRAPASSWASKWPHCGLRAVYRSGRDATT